MPTENKTAAPPKRPNEEKPPAPPTSPEKQHVTQGDREELLHHPEAVTLRKKSRIIALKMAVPFDVETDRGTMEGVAGDFLVTNHPEDDPESDLWSISAERIENTYTGDELYIGGLVWKKGHKDGYDQGYQDGLAARPATGGGAPTRPSRETVNAWWCGICDNSQPLTYKACLKCNTPRTPAQ